MADLAGCLGYLGIYDNTTRNLVELKTNITIRPPSHSQSAGDRQRFERKALRIWTQSFLLGVPTVMVGFRTPQGKVQSVQSFRTAEFPRMGRGGDNAGGNVVGNAGAGGQSGWDTRVVLGWGARALGFLRTTVEGSRNGDHPDSETAKYQEREEEKQREVWRVEFAPGRGIKLWKLGAEDVKDVETDEHVERVGLLPRWYWEEVTGRLLDVEREGGKEAGSTHVQLGEAGSTPVGPAEEGPVPTSTLTPSASVLKSTPNGVVPAGWSI
jgi:RAT1-interacting protein